MRDERWRQEKRRRGADDPFGTSAPRNRSALRTRAAAYMPAARSWSRSRRDVVGECCGRFSPSGAGASSWRCRATVRLATMAAMAMRLTPKVRISPPHLEGSWRAVRCDRATGVADSVPNDRSLPRTGVRRYRTAAQPAVAACRTTLQRARHMFPDRGPFRVFTASSAHGIRSLVPHRGHRLSGRVSRDAAGVRNADVPPRFRRGARLAGRGCGAPHWAPPTGGN